MSAELSNTQLRLVAAGLAAVAMLVAAAVASGAPAPPAPTPGPQVIVVFQADGCPPRNTVEVCEGITAEWSAERAA